MRKDALKKWKRNLLMLPALTTEQPLTDTELSDVKVITAMFMQKVLSGADAENWHVQVKDVQNIQGFCEDGSVLHGMFFSVIWVSPTSRSNQPGVASLVSKSRYCSINVQ